MQERNNFKVCQVEGITLRLDQIGMGEFWKIININQTFIKTIKEKVRRQCFIDMKEEKLNKKSLKLFSQPEITKEGADYVSAMIESKFTASEIQFRNLVMAVPKR